MWILIWFWMWILHDSECGFCMLLNVLISYGYECRDLYDYECRDSYDYECRDSYDYECRDLYDYECRDLHARANFLNVQCNQQFQKIMISTKAGHLETDGPVGKFVGNGTSGKNWTSRKMEYWKIWGPNIRNLGWTSEISAGHLKSRPDIRNLGFGERMKM